MKGAIFTHIMRSVYKSVYVCSLFCILYVTTLFAADINATITTGLFTPLQPINVGISVDDSSVLLSWSSPLSDGGTAITDYVIEYKLTSSGVWLVCPDTVSTNTYAPCTGLTNDSLYDFRVYAVNGIGQGPVSTDVQASPGVPAGVDIVNIQSQLVPDVTANVRITNLGVNAYMYSYVWCITDSVVNTCGGGNDVYSSTTASLIGAGVSFDTTLEALVSTEGTYWFHVEVAYGSDTAYTSESFITVVEGVEEEIGNSSEGSRPYTNFCRGADFNKDYKVNSIDYAILNYYFNSVRPFKNRCADMNNDRKINATDFSIFLTLWK